MPEWKRVDEDRGHVGMEKDRRTGPPFFITDTKKSLNRHLWQEKHGGKWDLMHSPAKHASRSSSCDYRHDHNSLPPAGVSCLTKNAKMIPKDFQKCVTQRSLSEKRIDFSLLQPPAGPHKDMAKAMVGQSRVDPATIRAVAGSSSEKFTYNMMNKEDWDFLQTKAEPKEERPEKPKKKASYGDDFWSVPDRQNYASNVIHRSQTKGGLGLLEPTDPITHFRHEGVVFKIPGKTRKKTDYYHTRAAQQTWTWQVDNDTMLRDVDMIKDKLDCRGLMHYMNAGEEDLIPAAAEDAIKCDIQPTDGHVYRNDKRCLSWCHRVLPSPRHIPDNNVRQKYGSDQVWECMRYEYPAYKAGDNVSIQCSLDEETDTGYGTPPQPRRGILTSAQSEPQFREMPREAWQDDAKSFYSCDQLDSKASSEYRSSSLVRGENVPPDRMQLLESRGSSKSGAARSATPRGNTTPRRRPAAARPARSVTPVTPRAGSTADYYYPVAVPRGGETTPREHVTRTPRGGGNRTPRSAGSQVMPSRSVTPRSATPRSATPRSTTPRRQSGRETPGAASGSWR